MSSKGYQIPFLSEKFYVSSPGISCCIITSGKSLKRLKTGKEYSQMVSGKRFGYCEKCLSSKINSVTLLTIAEARIIKSAFVI